MQTDSAPQMMSYFFHRYRKETSSIKIKSFYANHLCKKNCLQGALASNNDACLSECDQWLRKFFENLRSRRPEMAETILGALDLKASEVQKNEDIEYQKGVALAHQQMKSYLSALHGDLDRKIAAESKTN